MERTSGDGRFATADGTSLYYRWHRPAEERGRVILVHGAAEHADRYGHLVETLLAGGWSVHACDHRGLGRSEGLRGHVSDFGTYARDLAAFVEHIGGTDLPQVVYGHSMGGLIAIEYVAEHAEGLAGVVLSAPGIRLFRPPSRWTLRFGRFFAAFLPLLPMPPGIDPEGISSDPAVAVASKKDRMMTKRVSLRWMLEFVGAQGRVEGFARRIELPTLILQGTADGVIEPAGAADLAEWIPAEDVTLRTFPDGRHELHNEVPALRIPAMDAVAEWFDARWNGA